MVAFTDQQLAVVTADINKNIKVIAVPGSGKSTVLVHRIQHFLEHDILPERILVIMFGDSAAVNFRTSLEQLDFMNVPDVRTYHSLGRRICFYLSNANFMPQFTLQTDQNIYRKFYQSNLLLTIPEHLQSTLNPRSRNVIDDFLRFTELVKSLVTSPEAVFKEYKYELHKQVFIAAFKLAEKNRWDEKIQFFPDLVYDAVTVCHNNRKAYDFVSNRYDKVLVDEYQDSNQACHELLRLIAGTRANINVVGDDDQTIYDFTGSSPKFLISQIDCDFDHVSLFTLTKSFRFGHSVALAANNVISNNKSRIDKLCISARNDMHTHLSTMSYNQDLVDCNQYDLIKQISAWITDSGHYDDIAILFRQYSNTFGIELALLRNAIPYFIGKEKSTILHGRDANFLFSCLAILCQYTDFSEKMRIRHMCHYLTGYIWGVKSSLLTKTIKHLIEHQLDAALKAFNAVKNEIKQQDFKIILRRIKTFDKVRRSKDYTTANLLQKLVFEAGFGASIAKANWRDPVTSATKFQALFDFFSEISVSVDVVNKTLLSLKSKNEDRDQNDADTGGVELTTLHRSKGLAWPFVILPYLEEGIMPPLSAAADPYQIEVERRLFYVGVTRAQRKLAFHIPNDAILTRSLKDYQGKMNEVDFFKKGKASRFVYETNLISTTQIAMELRHNNRNSIISNTDNRELYNQYLYTLGKQYRISGLTKQ